MPETESVRPVQMVRIDTRQREQLPNQRSAETWRSQTGGDAPGSTSPKNKNSRSISSSLTNAAVEQYTSFSSDPFPVVIAVVIVPVDSCVADFEEEEEEFVVEAPEDGFGPCAIGKAVKDSEGDNARGRVEGASKLAGKIGILVSVRAAWAQQQEC